MKWRSNIIWLQIVTTNNETILQSSARKEWPIQSLISNNDVFFKDFLWNPRCERNSWSSYRKWKWRNADQNWLNFSLHISDIFLHFFDIPWENHGNKLRIERKIGAKVFIFFWERKGVTGRQVWKTRARARWAGKWGRRKKEERERQCVHWIL